MSDYQPGEFQLPNTSPGSGMVTDVDGKPVAPMATAPQPGSPAAQQPPSGTPAPEYKVFAPLSSDYEGSGSLDIQMIQVLLNLLII